MSSVEDVALVRIFGREEFVRAALEHTDYSTQHLGTRIGFKPATLHLGETYQPTKVSLMEGNDPGGTTRSLSRLACCTWGVRQQ